MFQPHIQSHQADCKRVHWSACLGQEPSAALYCVAPPPQFAELSILCQNVEKERDYYFERLMEIEALCREAEENGHSSLAIAIIKETLYREKVRSGLFAMAAV